MRTQITSFACSYKEPYSITDAGRWLETLRQQSSKPTGLGERAIGMAEKASPLRELGSPTIGVCTASKGLWIPSG